MIGNIFEYLPAINTIPGLVLFAVISYLVTLTFSICIGKFVSNNFNLEEDVKKKIIESRKRKEKEIEESGLKEKIKRDEMIDRAQFLERKSRSLQ